METLETRNLVMEIPSFFAQVWMIPQRNINPAELQRRADKKAAQKKDRHKKAEKEKEAAEKAEKKAEEATEKAAKAEAKADAKKWTVWEYSLLAI